MIVGVTILLFGLIAMRALAGPGAFANASPASLVPWGKCWPMGEAITIPRTLAVPTQLASTRGIMGPMFQRPLNQRRRMTKHMVSKSAPSPAITMGIREMPAQIRTTGRIAQQTARPAMRPRPNLTKHTGQR